MSNVAGVQTTAAQKSEDMLMKTQYLNDKFDCSNILFATGTPIPTPYKRFTFDFTPTGSSCFSSGIFL
jgi:N12 class adenine-specific DNA methylase